MSNLIDFYKNEFQLDGADFEEIVSNWSNDKWEYNHDFIQWLFPLQTPSAFNSDAPILTIEDIKNFKENVYLQNAVNRAFVRFLRFVGLRKKPWHEQEIKEIEQAYKLSIKVEDYYIEKDPNNWESRKSLWLFPNHNWLRITRVIASLVLLELQDEADILFSCITKLYNEGCGSPESFKYWQKAVEGKIT